MEKKWPFGFFVYNNTNEKKDAVQAESESVEAAAEPTPVEAVKVVWAETPATVVVEEEETSAPVEEVLPEDESKLEDIEETPGNDDMNSPAVFEEDEDEDAGLPDLEEELEIALEEAHQKEVKKHRLITGISAGVAFLGAVGLATGFAIHNHFKKK